jgi:hypothetical protein
MASLRNLAEALEQVFHQHRSVFGLTRYPQADVGLPLALADQPAVVEVPLPSPRPRAISAYSGDCCHLIQCKAGSCPLCVMS